MVWDSTVDQACRALVEKAIANDVAAWRALLVKIAGPIEGWAKGNRVLRRCRLTGDDDSRAVLVAVLERLAARDYANLRRFVERQEPEHDPDDEVVTAVVRLGRLDEEAEETPTVRIGKTDDDTPFRAWLLRLVEFVARDHVRERLGWGSGDASKRDLHSDAAPLSAVPERGTRPPMTDRLTVAKMIGEIQDHIATFPDDMRTAIELWLDDASLDVIGAKLALDEKRARALVRAGQARLREKFRGRSPLVFA
ncbi:MAG: hypothetical protein QM831_14820 [Kofleriaceae bacterium]